MSIFSQGALLAMVAATAAISSTTAATELTVEQQADVSRPPARVSAENCCSVLELRQYVLHPGQRDVLIELFEREFIEGQEAIGMWIFGQFHDLDNPDHFVWIRGFADMESRRHALNAFYYGPVWQANRVAANATLLDNDNVLLLRPGTPHSGFGLDRARPAQAAKAPSRLIVATIYYGKAPLDHAFAHWFETELKPVLSATGATPIAWFENEAAENTFPRLPVRQGENVFVWFAAFDHDAAYRQHLEQMEHSRAWRNQIAPRLEGYLTAPPQHLRLAPTAKSRLR